MTPDLRRGDVEPLTKTFSSRRKPTRMRQVSEKRTKAKPWTDAIRVAVFARDGGCVLHGETNVDCYGDPEPHHRRKANAAGAYSLTNLVTLCHRHNGLIEDEPEFFREHFPWLVVREGDEEYVRLGKRGAR